MDVIREKENNEASPYSYIYIISHLLISQLAHGEIYKWVDQKGNAHFTNIYRMVRETYRENVESRICVKRVIEGTSLLLISGEQVELVGVKPYITRGFRRSVGHLYERSLSFCKATGRVEGN